MIALGTRTRWGIVAAIGLLSGERYYWMVSEKKGTAPSVAMMPACVVEEGKG